jgi:hypothetical protein
MKRIFLLTLFVVTSASAWDGYDYENGTYVEIDKGNLVREGHNIEIYDYSGGYKDVEVTGISRSGGEVEVEVYDSKTGQHRTLSMED